MHHLFRHYSVFYKKIGTGPSLIMLHNAGTDHTIWDLQIEYYSKTYTIYAIDLLGFGKSDRPDISYSIDLYVEMLTDFVATLINEKIILFGNCIGASISLLFAKRYPDKVKCIVVSNVCGGISMMKDNQAFLFNRNQLWPISIYTILFKLTSLKSIKRAIVNRMFTLKQTNKDNLFKHIYLLQQHILHNQSRINTLKGLSSFNTFDIDFEYIGQNLPPALLFWGEDNKVMPVKNGTALSKRMHLYKYVIVKQSGHLLMYEQPALFNSETTNFLNTIST